MINLKNLVIYISGSNGKIGFSISKHILKYGGKLVLGDINIKKCKTLQKKFGNKNIIIIKGDHTKSKTIEKTLKTTKKKFGKIDAAINCAYPHTKDWGTPFEKLKKQSLNKNINFQLGGTIIFSQKLMNFFKKQKKGNLILISSILGTNAPKFFQYKNLKMNSPIEYSAVKAGIIAITKYLAEFYKKKKYKSKLYISRRYYFKSTKIF